MKRLVLLISTFMFFGCSETKTNKIDNEQPKVNTDQVGKINYSVVLDDLNDKTVLRGLYSKHFEPILVLADMDYFMHHNDMRVGIFYENTPYFAIYRNMQKYHNVNGEERFLVHVERQRLITKEKNRYGLFNECDPICTSNDDLFIFKKLENGKFALLSKTDKALPTPISYEMSQLDIEKLDKRMEKITESANGFFYIFGSGKVSHWKGHRSVIVLNEDKPISNVYIGVAKEESATKDGNLFLSTFYNSEVEVLKNEKPVMGFYTLKIKFSGDVKSNDTFYKENYNKIKLYEKDINENSYKEIFSKDY